MSERALAPDGGPESAGRYSRHRRIDGFDQDRVRALAVAVIGAGAIGNEVVKTLVLLGVGRIAVFDFDTVEIHNLTRSIFLRESDVGQGKAAAVVRRAAEVDPNVRVEAIDGDFRDTLGLAALARFDALVACVDSFEARIRANQLALLAGVDFVSAAIDARSVSVESFPRRRGGCGCYECTLPASAYQRMAERYSCGWLRRRGLAERIVPTTAITAGIAGALVAEAVLRLPDATGATRTFVDTRAGTARRDALARRADCPGCAGLIPPPPRRAARGRWREVLAALADSAGNIPAEGPVAIRLQDPVITAWRCRACGSLDGAAAIVGRRACDFDDGITRCPACGAAAAEVEIRDRFSADELGRWPAPDLPVAFLLAMLPGGTVCIDLQEDCDE